MLSIILIVIATLLIVLGAYYASGILCNIRFFRKPKSTFYILILEKNIDALWDDVNYIQIKNKNSKIIVLCDNVVDSENTSIYNENNIIYATQNTLIDIIKKEKQI